MPSKNEIVLHPYNVVMIIWIVITKMSENLYLDSSLMMKSLLVSDYFKGYVAIFFIVIAA